MFAERPVAGLRDTIVSASRIEILLTEHRDSAGGRSGYRAHQWVDPNQSGS